MNEVFRIRAHSTDFNRSLELAVFKEDKTTGTYSYAMAPLAFTTYYSGACIEPLIRIRCEEAQSLMDDLWNAGIRPTDFRNMDNSSEVVALKTHISDLRKLVDKGFGTNLGLASIIKKTGSRHEKK